MAVFTGSGSAASPSITFSEDTDTGIYRPGANEISLVTGGTNRISVTPGDATISLGNVFSVTNGNFSMSTGRRIEMGGTDNRGNLQISQPAQVTTPSGNRAVSIGNNMFISSVDGTWVQRNSAIGGAAITLEGRNNEDGAIQFWRASDQDVDPEAFTLSGGFSPLGRFFVGSNSTDGSVNSIRLSNGVITLTRDSTASRQVAAFRNPNGAVGSISTDGTSTVYATSSDYRLKENVVPLENATERLKQLPVHRFNFLSDPEKTVDGFIAHEAQLVVPEAVTGEKDAVVEIGNVLGKDGEILLEGVEKPEGSQGDRWVKTGEVPAYQGIDQAKLVPLLTAALQEAVSRIEALEAQLS
jgi:hypothetical protein